MDEFKFHVCDEKGVIYTALKNKDESYQITDSHGDSWSRDSEYVNWSILTGYWIRLE